MRPALVVALLIASTATGPAPAGDAAPVADRSAAPRTRVYRYDVSVVGRLHDTAVLGSGAPDFISGWERTLAWTGTFRGVRVRARIARAAFGVTLVGARRVAGGRIALTERYRSSVQFFPLPPSVDCGGTIALSLAARLGVTAAGLGAPRFAVRAQLTSDSAARRAAAVRADWENRCNGQLPPALQTASEFPGPEATTVRPLSDLLRVFFDRRRRPASPTSCGGAARREELLAGERVADDGDAVVHGDVLGNAPERGALLGPVQEAPVPRAARRSASWFSPSPRTKADASAHVGVRSSTGGRGAEASSVAIRR